MFFPYVCAQMNRQFHAKIQIQSWILLAAFLFLTVYAAWVRHPIFMAMGFLLMVILVERMIHTLYIVTDTSLRIHTSRFVADREVPLADIRRIDEVSTMRLFGKSLHRFLMVVYADAEGQERQVAVMPARPAEFVDYIQKRRMAAIHN